MNIQEFDFNVDLLQAILWQYNDASNLQGILNAKQDWYNQEYTAFWDDWYTNVFNLQTANDFGCSVWAQILGVTFTVQLEPQTNGAIFGFGSFNQNFYHSNFGSITFTPVSLSLEQKRLVLRLRYFQLVSRGTIPEINKFMASLFGEQGKVLVIDNYDMTITFLFNFQPTSDTLFIFDNYDLLPRPAGVGVSLSFVTRDVFGFGSFNQNFFNSTFVGE